jgi:Protein of unknown function (DUF742)
MPGESGGEHRTPEPTFADVMNGFSFDRGRSTKRRRWGRRGDDEPLDQQDTSATPVTSTGSHAAGSIGRLGRDAAEDPPVPSWPSTESPSELVGTEGTEFDPLAGVAGASASVRPYAWTGGRTRSGCDLQLETLVSTSSRGREQLALLAFEHRSVAQLCERAQSVAEIAALLCVPLGVAKVLVGDMAGLGLVVVHQSVGSNGDVPDLALMERVLSGLRRL